MLVSNMTQINIDNMNARKHLNYRNEISQEVYNAVNAEMDMAHLSPLTDGISTIHINDSNRKYDFTVEPEITYNYAESYMDPYGSEYRITTLEPNRIFNELPSPIVTTDIFDSTTRTIKQDCYMYTFQYIPTKYTYAPRQAISVKQVTAGTIVPVDINKILFLTDSSTYALSIPPNAAVSNNPFGVYETPLVKASVSEDSQTHLYTVKLNVHNIESYELRFIKGNVIPTVNGKQVATTFRGGSSLTNRNTLMKLDTIEIVSEFPPAISIKHKLINKVEWKVSNINYALKSIVYEV